MTVVKAGTERAYVFVGVVILYGCGAEFVRNAFTYVNGLDFLLVIDNSAEANDELQSSAGLLPHTEYRYNGKNLGISAALNLALDWAKLKGADFLLTMDQDSRFGGDTFKEFRKEAFALKDLEEIAVIAPCFGGAYTVEGDDEIVDSFTVITSGSIINLRNCDKIGRFDENLFIDEVDHDFCIRAHDVGLRVVYLRNIKLEHQLGTTVVLRIFGRRVAWNVHSPLRHYYMLRNSIYMITKHRELHLSYCVWRAAKVMLTILAAIALRPERLRRLNFLIVAVLDAFFSRMGPRY